MSANRRVVLIVPESLLLRVRAVVREHEGETFQQFVRNSLLQSTKAREAVAQPRGQEVLIEGTTPAHEVVTPSAAPPIDMPIPGFLRRK